MPVPFRIIDWYDYGFPECWKMIDFKMTDNNDGVVPIYKYYEKLMHFMLKFDLPDEETSYACASILLTMAIWRTNKQIFVFYKEGVQINFWIPFFMKEQIQKRGWKSYSCLEKLNTS